MARSSGSLDRAGHQLAAEFPEFGFNIAGFEQDLFVLDGVVFQFIQDPLKIGDLSAEICRQKFFFQACHSSGG